MDGDVIDLGCREAVHDPAQYFGRWLQHGPAHEHRKPSGVALIGHAAVSEAFRDAETLSADRVSVLERVAARHGDEFGQVVDLLRGWMIFRDPPAHTRLRVPVRSAFTPKRVLELEPLVDRIVDEAFEDLERSGDGDVTRHVARPVPAQVIGALLGLERHEGRMLQDWSDQLAAIVFALSPGDTPIDGVVQAARSFHEFFGDVVDRRAGDGTLLGTIAALDTSFDRVELIGLCTMLLFAGHETTTSLIQQMTAVLLERPELADQLRAVDDLGPAVDEFMRCFGPARTMVRKAAVDHERAGVELRAGTNVLLSIAGANHDPDVFVSPGTLDLGRDPNPHLGFGWGLHHCLGAQLARLEAASFLRHLLDRYPELRPEGDVPALTGAVMGFGRAGAVRIALH